MRASCLRAAACSQLGLAVPVSEGQSDGVFSEALTCPVHSDCQAASRARQVNGTLGARQRLCCREAWHFRLWNTRGSISTSRGPMCGGEPILCVITRLRIRHPMSMSTRPMLCFVRILARISILSNGSRREIAISTMASVAAYDRLGLDHRAEPTICSRLRTTGRSSAARRLYVAR